MIELPPAVRHAEPAAAGGNSVMEGPVVVAIDVGGTSIKAALVGPEGTGVVVGYAGQHPTAAAQGPAAVSATIVRVAERWCDLARAHGIRPAAIGLAMPGVVDEASGRAVCAVNLGLRDVAIRDLLADRVDMPVVLCHDVRAGAAAEARLGAGRGCRDLLFVALGTGIAAAHVVGGRPWAGAHGAAGELGHVPVRQGGPRCGCGRTGCLEAVASASAIARRYATGAGAEAVVAAAAAGDPAAARVWHEAIEALASGLAIAHSLLDVDLVVLGGGLARAGQALLAPVRASLARRLTFQHRPAVATAQLGDRSGCLGAALHALDTLGHVAGAGPATAHSS